MPVDTWQDAPWEHPDWYDLHDVDYTAGPGREPEHYRERVLALPPLDTGDHLVDVGAGTGKLALLIAASYPRLGRVTLVDPNADKLARAEARLRDVIPQAAIQTIAAGVGEGVALPVGQATVVTLGSVLMPLMEIHPGTLGEARAWLQRSLHDLRGLLVPGGRVYAVETMAAPWVRSDDEGPARRLSLPEMLYELEQAGFRQSEVVYRFRDRVVIRMLENRG